MRNSKLERGDFLKALFLPAHGRLFLSPISNQWSERYNALQAKEVIQNGYFLLPNSKLQNIDLLFVPQVSLLWEKKKNNPLLALEYLLYLKTPKQHTISGIKPFGYK